MTDTDREAFEAWAKSKGAPKQDWWIRQIDDGGYSCFAADLSWEAYQAATQRQQSRIAELEAEVAKLTTALFECREALPIPAPGSPTEAAWMGAMTDPEDVPEFVRAEVQALRKDAERYRWLRNCDLDAMAANHWPCGQVPIDEAFDAAIDAAIDAAMNKEGAID